MDAIADIAMDGLDAVEMIKKNAEENDMKLIDYDLILMDANMPKMDGYQASLHIREFCFENNLRQPIITAITG